MARHEAPHLPAHDQRPRHGREERDDALREAHLLREGVEVEDGVRGDDVDLARQGREGDLGGDRGPGRRIGGRCGVAFSAGGRGLPLLLRGGSGVFGGEEVRDDEAAAEGAVVAEEVVAEVDEARFEVEAVEVPRGGAVGDEFAQVLREAAAEVEEGLRGVVGAEAGEDFGVEGVAAEAEVEEAVLADAGVRVDGEGAGALEMGRRGGGEPGSVLFGGVKKGGGMSVTVWVVEERDRGQGSGARKGIGDGRGRVSVRRRGLTTYHFLDVRDDFLWRDLAVFLEEVSSWRGKLPNVGVVPCVAVL